jgi:predicted permease
LPASQTPNPAAIATAETALLNEVASRPGVRAAATAYDHPLEANWSENLTIVGDSTAEEQRQQVELRIVSPGYFEALDVELLDGRTLNQRDTLGAPGVAIVNEAFARAVGGRVLGRRLRSSPPRFTYGAVAPAEFEVVGVVRNERFRGLERPAQPAYYLSTRQFPQTAVSLLVRSEGDPLAIATDVRSAVRAANAATTFSGATSLDRILADQLAQRRLTTEVIGGFAMAALALAALGMYGVLTMLVGSRTREIGVRLAVGASPSSIAQNVVGDALRSAAAGIASGCVLAMASGSMLKSQLVGVTPGDPVTLGVVAGILVTVAAFAAVIPARRAARIDPLEALRAE